MPGVVRNTRRMSCEDTYPENGRLEEKREWAQEKLEEVLIRLAPIERL
jgi:hypothetical protein